MNLRLAVTPRARLAASRSNTNSMNLGLVVLLAGCLAAGISIWWFRSAPTPVGATANSHRLSSLYDPPRTALQLALIQGDGQLFASEAVDPLAAHPERIRGDFGVQAYRLQRPLLGWMGWLGSGADRDAVPVALIVLSVVSVVALTAVVGYWIRAQGHDPAVALLVPFLPGALTDLVRVGPEALATALALLGCLAWLRSTSQQKALAVAAFALAALGRESLLILPIALAVDECWRHRRLTKPAVKLLASGLPYLGWLAVIRVRVGAWPSSSANLSKVPLEGLIQGMSHWSWPDVLFFMLSVALAVWAFVVTRARWIRLVIAAHAVFAAVFGEIVWMTWTGFGRVLLPVNALCLVVLATTSESTAGEALCERDHEAKLRVASATP